MGQVMKKYGVGVIGCGNISDIYLTNLSQLFNNLELIGCADLFIEKAQAQATKHATTAYTVDELLAHPSVDIILNITIPKAHREICEAALLAGKHVYVEKPLSLTVTDGQFLIELAKKQNLYIGAAPDTFLGGGIATCQKLIRDGWIGDIIGANAFMLCHGHESWHPDPEFYYDIGGGPMYDMGPYYLSALTKLIGPVSLVAGMTLKGFDTRLITSAPKKGTEIPVHVPTHITGLLRFENGAIGQLTTSFDVWGAQLPRIEIYGTKGTLSVPDPNTFGGPVLLMTEHDKTFREIPLSYGFTENSRGLGISNMAQAIHEEGIHEASGALAFHVLEIMDALHRSSSDESFIKINSRF